MTRARTLDGAAAQAGPAEGAKAGRSESSAPGAASAQESTGIRCTEPAADAAGSVVPDAHRGGPAARPHGDEAGAAWLAGIGAEAGAGAGTRDGEGAASAAPRPAPRDSTGPVDAKGRPAEDPSAENTPAAAAPGPAADAAPEAAAPGPPAAPPVDPVLGRDGLSTLLRRADFLKAASARRWSAPSMVVQARRRKPEEGEEGARIGYTCSKKVGNAVARNRAKRRLRAAAAEALPGRARAGWDYVLIGRRADTADRPFPQLVADLALALDKLHAGKGKPGGPPRRKGHGRGKGGSKGAGKASGVGGAG